MPATNVYDYYEALQLSPSADPEMIHRVYRLLAQRYHPDNTDSGDPEAFRQVLEAYQVLSDPEKRAAYDVEHRNIRRLWWKIFDQPSAARGIEAERRKRLGILALLYVKKANDLEQPWMTIREIEDLLGCPREHLQFSLWYLRDYGLIQRGDNGRFEITAKGVDEAEKAPDTPLRSSRPLLAPAVPGYPDIPKSAAVAPD